MRIDETFVIWDVSVAFFHSPMDEFTVVRPHLGPRVKGKLLVLNRAPFGTRMASRCFGNLLLRCWRMHSLKQYPLSQTRIIINRETLTRRALKRFRSCCGRRTVGSLQASSREFYGDQASREYRTRSLKHRKSAQACRPLERRRIHLGGGSKVDREADQHSELEWWKGSTDPWRQRHRERRSRR